MAENIVSPKIVLADSDLKRRAELREVLQELAAIRPFEAQSADEALKACRSGADVLFVHGPIDHTDAADVCRKIKSDEKTADVRVLISSSTAPSLAELSASKADVYLPDTTDPAALAGALISLVHLRGALRECDARDRQQAALVELGRLSHENVPAFCQAAVQIVADASDADCCGVFELSPQSADLILKWGVGWKNNAAGSATVPSQPPTIFTQALLSGVGARVEGSAASALPALLREHAITGGVVAPIGLEVPIGALGVFRRHPSSADGYVRFTESACALIAHAFEHQRSSESITRLQAQLDARGTSDEYRQATTTRTADEREQPSQTQKMDAIGRLAGGIAHDFANLLTIVTSYTEFLSEFIPPGHELTEQVDEIRQAADRAAGLTRQLLAFSRQQALTPRVTDLNAIVAKADARLRQHCRAGIQIETAYGPGGRINTDPSQIEQVVLNLAYNGIEAMPHGGHLRIRTAQLELNEQEARHLGISSGKYASISVTDTGTGMDAETRAHLFEPFFTTKGRDGGGLGLAVAYGIVKQSGGHIAVESAPGQGTTFSVYLPRLDEDAAAAAASAKVRVLPRRAETILLVEDDEGVRKLVRRVLVARGYAVLEAKDGSEALAMFESQQTPIHLLITDIVMPRMGGFELAERVAVLHPETRVLYISGYSDDAGVRAGTTETDIPFLQKPFTPEVLANRVRELLDLPPE